MAIPNPPTKPPARGNSQQIAMMTGGGPPVTAIPHDAAQQKSRPREMHPAVQEAMGRYAQIWEENDKLRDDNIRLAHENDVLRKLDTEKSALIESLRAGMVEAQKITDQRLAAQETHYRGRLAEAERAKERYLRYAVSISTDLKAAIQNLEAADQTAMDMAHTPSDKQLSEIDAAIAEATQTVER